MELTCLDPYFASFEECLASKDYKPWTLKNYRCLTKTSNRPNQRVCAVTKNGRKRFWQSIGAAWALSHSSSAA
jgi:hypothetical protein